MKYLKKFNEYYNPGQHAGFIGGNTTSFGSSSNTGGIASSSAAGTPAKDIAKSGPESLGPEIEKYEDTIKNLKSDKIKKKKKPKKIIRNHPGENE